MLTGRVELVNQMPYWAENTRDVGLLNGLEWGNLHKGPKFAVTRQGTYDGVIYATADVLGTVRLDAHPRKWKNPKEGRRSKSKTERLNLS